jgi:hypothetical protein
MSSAGAASPNPGLLPETTLVDLDAAWNEREQEANLLMTQGFSSIGLALRLYALEIRLKVLICKQLRLSVLPKACKTHDLSELIIFTGMWEELGDPVNSTIRQNWDFLVDFSKKDLNNLRYIPRQKLAASELSNLIAALDDTQNGVLSSLSRHP